MIAYCAWCDDEFNPTSTRQLYCSIDCRNAASKEKIMARQTLNKRRKRMSKVRLCNGGCGTQLSIYNDAGICDHCISNKKKMAEFMKEIKEHLDHN